MKTIYTDRYARLGIWLLFAAFFAFEAVRTPVEWFMALCIVFAIAFLFLAGFGFKATIEAKRRAENSSIYEVVDDA